MFCLVRLRGVRVSLGDLVGVSHAVQQFGQVVVVEALSVVENERLLVAHEHASGQFCVRGHAHEPLCMQLVRALGRVSDAHDQ